MKDVDSTVPSEALFIQRMRLAWQQSGSIDFNKFVPDSTQPQRLSILRALVVEDIKARKEHGLDADLQQRLSDFQELAVSGELLEQWLDDLNQLLGDQGPEPWWRRLECDFPRFAQSCEERFAARQSKPCTSTSAIQLPSRIGDFELLSVLGEGTHGRVYLAREIPLDRLVALKVSAANPGDIQERSVATEGRMLARLSHQNIVQVYREETLENKNLLAMQFVAGKPLSDWIVSVKNKKRELVTGADFLGWACQVDVPEEVRKDLRQSDVDASMDRAFVSVVIARTMADALHHAHQRGILHHDVKPSNMIVEYTGCTLLTDFNVASHREQSGRQVVGGTIAYMAPEHLKSLAADLGGDDDAVDARSDLYSLGIVLYEMLTGSKHWNALPTCGGQGLLNILLADRLRSGPPSIQQSAKISSSLAAIVEKALAPNPRDRYQTARDFSTDLQCWLDRRPNRFANQGDWREMLARWVRRHHTGLLAAGAAVFIIAVAVFTSLRSEYTQLARCEMLATEAQNQLVQGNGANAAEQIGKAKATLEQLALSPRLSARQYAQTALAVENVSRQIGNYEMQRFVSRFGDATLARIHEASRTDGADLIGNALRSYGVLTRSDWQQRSPFIDLDASGRRQVAENISELLFVAMLQRERVFDESELSDLLRRFPIEHQQLIVVQNLRPIAQGNLPKLNLCSDSFDAYLLGVLRSQSGNDASAYEAFTRSISLRPVGRPTRFWTHYWLGYTCQRIGKFEEAQIRFGTCLGIRPDFVWPHFNMGLACIANEQPDLGCKFLRAAISIQPEFLAPYVALGASLYGRGRYDEALAIYESAISKRLRSSDLFHNQSLCLSKLGRIKEAIAAAQKAIKEGAGGQTQRLLSELQEQR